MSVAVLRRADGTIIDLDGRLWLDDVNEVDADVLTRARGPVIDVGCGPGRHTRALAQRGEIVMGIDLSTHAVELARSKGLAVLERSIFEILPKHGEWECALLLDGNIGIGGDPLTLLRRVGDALRGGGSMLIEAGRHSNEGEYEVVRLEIDNEPGPWFPWSHVDTDLIKSFANDLDLNVVETWNNSGRSFVHLTTTLKI